MSRRPGRRTGPLPLVLGVVLLAALMFPTQVIASAPADPDVPVLQGRPYPGNPATESRLVGAEDARLVQVRTMGMLSQWRGAPTEGPYRLATSPAYTLVLTERADPYTIDDLLRLAPQTFVRRPDGAFLLSENIVIQSGATLSLAARGRLRLLLASDPDGFVSIINDGGRLNLTGAEGATALVTSFDRAQRTPDTVTDDGRAYIRSIGGQVSISDTDLRALGFWSGRTGGLSLTGTDRPHSGSIDELTDSPSPATPVPTGPSVRGDKDSPGKVVPANPLVPLVDVDAPEYSIVSASLQRTRVTQSVFGLFVSGANGLDIRDSSFSHNLVSGLVLHRYVVNTVIDGTSTTDNGQDGVVLARATTGIELSDLKAVNNARNGVTMSGRPLAEGPSATGTSMRSYGNNTISNSVASDNGRYGIEVIGGKNLRVLANEVDSNSVGIVVREGARAVSVIRNRVGGSVTQGIAVRDGVSRGVVSGNQVRGGETSVYLRDSAATIENNTLAGADSHAVSLVGDVGDTLLDDNTISGRGRSAIDTRRADAVDPTTWKNDVDGWDESTPPRVAVKRFLLRPLTLMWLLIAVLLLITALHGARTRRHSTFAHPYADTLPLQDAARPEPERALHESTR